MAMAHNVPLSASSYSRGMCVHSAGTARTWQEEIGGFCYNWQYPCLYRPYYTPTTLDSLMFPCLACLPRTREGVSDLPSRTPGRAALIVAEFLWLAPRDSPRQKHEANVLLRLIAFHARPWHLL